MEKHDAQGNEPLGGYLAAGTVAIWSGFILISRLGGKTVLSAADILALRLAVASLLLLPFCRDIGGEHWRNGRLWLLALVGGVAYGWLVYAGLKQAPAAHGAILLPGLQPFLIAALLWALFGRRIDRRRWPGMSLIAVGIGCAAVLGGDALILASSTAWALYGLLARHWGFAPWLLTRFVALASALAFLPLYLLFLPKQVCTAPLLDEAVDGWLLAGLVFVSLGAFLAVRPLP